MGSLEVSADTAIGVAPLTRQDGVHSPGLAAPSSRLARRAPRWDPTCESREDYQQRHERYLQMLETQAEQDGLVDAPIKHAPEHFEWLALYHFGKWTVERIAGEFGGKHGLEDRSSIRDWLPPRIWSFNMDAVAIGVILMVLTSLYMGWQRLKVHPVGSMASFALGIIVTVYFMWGLAWLG